MNKSMCVQYFCLGLVLFADNATKYIHFSRVINISPDD